MRAYACRVMAPLCHPIPNRSTIGLVTSSAVSDAGDELARIYRVGILKGRGSSPSSELSSTSMVTSSSFAPPVFSPTVASDFSSRRLSPAGVPRWQEQVSPAVHPPTAPACCPRPNSRSIPSRLMRLLWLPSAVIDRSLFSKTRLRYSTPFSESIFVATSSAHCVIKILRCDADSFLNSTTPHGQRPAARCRGRCSRAH